jgi:hypothetical protein
VFVFIADLCSRQRFVFLLCGGHKKGLVFLYSNVLLLEKKVTALAGVVLRWRRINSEPLGHHTTTFSIVGWFRLGA